MKDGWHKLYRYEVYTENGKVMRGTNREGTVPVYPYRSIRGYSGLYNAVGYYTLDSFRKAVKNGTAVLR